MEQEISRETTINQVNKLLAANIEAETKLRNGVANVKDDKLKSDLRKYSLLHYHYGKDLEDKIIRKNGGKSKINELVKEIHFASSTLASMDNINVDTDIINDCTQAEENVLNEYRSITNSHHIKESDYAMLKSHQRE